ncbi:uncharacterized protein VTP21DRAFT_6006 [Calcarisporiella thermophila]|uniref:uncharacterized protein n=1 Tax=Calcarisporiella thermophila TaxID=911321 RepID=UPI003742BCA9
MATNYRNITVVGGTGGLGSAIVRGLLDTGAFSEVRVLTRSSQSEAAKALKKLGATIVEIENYFKQEDLKSALAYSDVVINTFGYNREDTLKVANEILRAAKAAGVKRYIPNEFGTDPRPGKLRYQNSAHHELHDKEKHLNLVKESGIEYTTFYVGFFMEGTFGPWFGFDTDSRQWTIVGDGKQKVSFTSHRDIGRCVAESVKHIKFANRELSIGGDTITLDEACSYFENAIADKIERKYVSVKEQEQSIDESFSFEKMLCLFAGDGSLDHWKNDNEELNSGESKWKWDRLIDFVTKLYGQA